MPAWPAFNPSQTAETAPWGMPETPAQAGNSAEPSPSFVPAIRKPSPRLKLETAAHCRREVARIYREARRGELKPETATKLAYLVDLISRMIERSELEKRVEALEDARK